MDRRAEARSLLLFGLLLGLGSAACGSKGTSTTGSGGATTGSGGTSGGAGTGSGGAGTAGAIGNGGVGGGGAGTGAAGRGGGGTMGIGGSGNGGSAVGGAGTAGRGGRFGGAGGSGRGGRGAGGVGGGGGMSGSAGAGGAAANGDAGGAGGGLARFSFFVTSIDAMRLLSNSQLGFGGDLRHGEATGLAGADKICTEVAESSMPGAGAKTWRAFLSTVGPPVVNAIERVGNGPWYDRLGRLVAANRTNLAMTRPLGADPAIINDLPNEAGTPNRLGVDNHDMLTGSNAQGNLDPTVGATCADWTSSAAVANMAPRVGHSWPANSGMNWMSVLYEGGCGPGVNLVQQGPPIMGVFTVGTGGGYGGIYCFALTP